jgi:hypothetical protein
MENLKGGNSIVVVRKAYSGTHIEKRMLHHAGITRAVYLLSGHASFSHKIERHTLFISTCGPTQPELECPYAFTEA